MTPEDKIQKNIVDAVRLVYPFPKALIFSVPNGGFRYKLTALVLKATGLMPGVSDLILLFKGRVYFAEVKTSDGTQSDNQKEFQRKVEAMGFTYFIVRSANDMLERMQKC
jgi:hypothetical protein